MKHYLYTDCGFIPITAKLLKELQSEFKLETIVDPRTPRPGRTFWRKLP